MVSKKCTHENTSRVCTPHAQVNCSKCPTVEFYILCDDCGDEVVK